MPALVYLRLSLYLRPSSDLTAVTLASLFEQLKRSDQAIAAYGLVPSSSPLKMGADIQIALELDGMGKTDEAMRRLTDIVAGATTRCRRLERIGRVAAICKEIRRGGGDLRPGDCGRWNSTTRQLDIVLFSWNML